MRARVITLGLLVVVCSAPLWTLVGCGLGKRGLKSGVEPKQPLGPAEQTGATDPVQRIASLYRQGVARERAAWTNASPEQAAQMRSAGLATVAQAYEAAKTLVQTDPANPWAHFWLGVTAEHVGRREEAKAAYNKALQLKSDYAEAYNNLGDIYEWQEKWASAISHYQKALQFDPSLAESYAGLADVHRKNGAYAKAASLYAKAIQLDPRDAVSSAFLEPCQAAAAEQKENGYVTAPTLTRLASVESQLRSRAGALVRDGQEIRGLEKPPDTPRVAMSIQFPQSKYALSDLSKAGRAQLTQAVEVLASAEWKGKQIAIEGYACCCGSDQHNLDLSRKRGEAIKAFLIAQHVVDPGNVLVIPHGEENPLVDTGNHDLPPDECERDESHKMNRRVVIRQWRGEAPSTNPGQPPNPDPPRASAKVSFWYKPTGSSHFRRLTDGAKLKSGDEIEVYVCAFHPVYLYVFNRTISASSVSQLCVFPNDLFCKQAPATNPLQPGRDYWIPRFGEGLSLCGPPGEEQLIAYVSATPDPTLDALTNQIKDPASTPPNPAPISPSTSAPPKAPGAPPPSASSCPVALDSEQPGQQDVVVLTQSRGVGGVIVVEHDDVYLPSNWHAMVRFQHL